MIIKNFNWKIGGPAGFGIMSAGQIFSRAFTRNGYNVIDGNEYPSLIKGGHNAYTVRVSSEKIYSLSGNLDILVALDKNSIRIHSKAVSPGGYIIYDEKDMGAAGEVGERKDITYFDLPMKEITDSINIPKIIRNNVALGSSLAFTDIELESLNSAVKDNFSRKGEEVVKSNLRAVELGYRYTKEKLGRIPFSLNKTRKEEKLLLTGNDSVFLGAVRAGCKFYAAYPMTPASSILHSFASVENEHNIIVKHAESEIAVVNMAIGASYAGVRSLLATSGGGFALMNEGLSAAAMTETPLVMVLCQRPAPATGLPTWTEQGDLLFAVHSSHGEFLRVVMAPGDPEEAFYMTGEAFNLAEKYQIPVIILLDKYLSESHFSYDSLDPSKIKIERGKYIRSEEELDDDYLRYRITDDGISPRAIPGIEKGPYIANTDEHDEYGFSDDSAQNRKNMVDKRFKKINRLIDEIPEPKKYGPDRAKVTIWSWGSCKGPVLEAINMMNGKKNMINLLHFNYIYPFRADAFEKNFDENNMNIIIENNKTAQFSKLIKMYTGKEIKTKILKYNGRQFLPEEIASAIDELI
jgi:2-oxoglutarate/2-oxoacid ferredoxin oxidoreductase subunit alpha